LRILSDLDTPWDDSDNSFLTDPENENDTNSVSSIQTLPSKPMPTPIPDVINPYPATILPNQQSTIMGTLQTWINPRQQNPTQLPTPPATILIATPPTHTMEHHQQSLRQMRHNQHWGDPMIQPKPRTTFHILSCNVNTLSTQNDYLQWKAAVQVITTSEADAVSIQELNVAWNKINKWNIQQILKQPTGNALIATTISTEIQTLLHQQGGALQALLGNWVPHTVDTGQDTTGLGRWSFIKLQGQNNKRYILLSGYHICENQCIDLGSNNTYNQQYQLLHQQGHHSPDLQTQFLNDLIPPYQQMAKSQQSCLSVP